MHEFNSTDPMLPFHTIAQQSSATVVLIEGGAAGEEAELWHRWGRSGKIAVFFFLVNSLMCPQYLEHYVAIVGAQ